MIAALQGLVEPETAGDPMGDQKWVRSSLRQLSVRLTDQGHAVSHTTVGRLLDKLDYALQVNAKQLAASAAHPERNDQFEHIAAQRQAPAVNVHDFPQDAVGRAVPYGIYDLIQNRARCMLGPRPTRPSSPWRSSLPGGRRWGSPPTAQWITC